MSERREVGPRSREIVAREQQHIAPGSQSFSLYSGLAMARGRGSILIDEDGCLHEAGLPTSGQPGLDCRGPRPAFAGASTD